MLFISVFGTFFHFLYDISNKNKIIGLFTAINESTWEHIKIALTPTFLWSLVDGIVYGNNPNYFLAKLLSIIVIVVSIPFLFYGYKFLFKKNNSIFNIITFYLAIIFSQFIFQYVCYLKPINFFINYLSIVFLIIIFGCYLLLTLLPLKNFIFKDPITGKYGFNRHPK